MDYQIVAIMVILISICVVLGLRMFHQRAEKKAMGEAFKRTERTKKLLRELRIIIEQQKAEVEKIRNDKESL